MTIEVKSNAAAQAQNTAQAGESKTAAETKPEVVAKAATEIAEASGASKATEEVAGAEGTEVDETEGADGEESEVEEKGEAEAKPKKSGFKKRIDKLRQRASTAEERAQYFERKYMELEGKSAAQKPDKQTAQTVAQEGKPKQEDFETHAEYVEAITDWKLEQKEKAKEAKAKEESLKGALQKQLDAHNARLEEFKKKQTDFVSVIEDFTEEHGNVSFSPALEEAIVSSENGPALIYELAKNKAEFDRINALGVVAASREIGKLEARLAKAAEASTNEVKTTQAPKPITPVGSKAGSGTKKSIYDPNISQAEYESLRMEQMKSRNSAWG